ncbi:MAG: peptidylprolyl isomerase [Cyanobacteria bacterium P01_A01_bin.123]
MTPVIKVGDRTLTASELVDCLTRHQLMPRLIQELLIDEAIASVDCNTEEVAIAHQTFYQKHQLASEADKDAWRQQRGVSPDAFEALILRDLKLEKYKAQTWETQVESYFLQRKTQLDRVLYSLIRTEDAGLAQELYFRIHDDGESFSDLSRQYSEGQEAQTGGLIGPVELSVPHPTLAKMLSISQPNQIWSPTRIGEWFIIVRLEKFVPAQMDEAMRQRLLNELFSQWLQTQLKQVAVQVLTLPQPPEPSATDLNSP